MKTRIAIIVAGGSGTRMKSEIPKQFLELDGVPILITTLKKYKQSSADRILLVIPREHQSYCEQLLNAHKMNGVELVTGGAERFHSVQNGLTHVKEEKGLVAIHDAVRPMISSALVDASFEQAEAQGSAVMAVPLKDSIRELNKENSVAKDRSKYMLIQTPQTFRLADLQKAYKSPYQSTFTDDASVYEHAGHAIHLLMGDYKNIKITTPEDLQVASVFLKNEHETI